MTTTTKIVAQLAQLRQQIEEGCGEPVHQLNLNAACVLRDVADALGLADDQMRQVLGPGAYAAVHEHPVRVARLLVPAEVLCPPDDPTTLSLPVEEAADA
jgi:hypothetical protein